VKFGGDYLIYPGDPNNYHSLYVAHVVLPDHKIHVMEIVLDGRLATTVKKTALYCSWDDYQNLSFFSLEWTGWN
jgi:tRNA-splicing endonuclease subunit Sen34